MRSSEEYSSPQATDDTASAITSAGEPSIEPIASFMVTAPFAFLELMSQCALTWVNMSASLADANPVQDADEQRQAFLGNGATTLEAAWFAAPIVTGIEETLNDQIFQPRPRKTQERDILSLWERSNEFDAMGSKQVTLTPTMRESESRSQAA